LVADILNAFGNEVDSLNILPSSGGVFEIWKNDELVFSKKQTGRFPMSNDEVIQLLN